MREILFRGQRVDNNEWVYGCYFDTSKSEMCNYLPTIIAGGGMDINNFHLVKPESISQFTGLTDKKGIKIFEGDRVLYDGIIGVVFYNSGTCMYMVRFELTRSIYSFDSLDREIEIIGNIHEDGNK